MLSERNKQVSAIQRREPRETHRIWILWGEAADFALKHRVYKFFCTIRVLLFLFVFHNLHSIQYASRNGHFSNDKPFVQFFSLSTFIHFFALAIFIPNLRFHPSYRRKSRHQCRSLFRFHIYDLSFHTSLAKQAEKSNFETKSERRRSIWQNWTGREWITAAGWQSARTAEWYGALIERRNKR